MSKLITNISVVFLLLFSATKLHATEMDDVIYLSNGGVIRDVIVEHLLKDGVYKIQSSGGNIFVYKSEEIDKITKEPKLAIGQSGTNTNINNVNTNTAETEAPVTLATLPDSSPSRRHAIGISTWGLNMQNAKTNEDSTFDGAALTYQYGLNDHLAIRISFYSAEHEDFSQIKIEGRNGQLLLTTKARDNGFKFYVGVGYFSEDLKNDFFDFEENFSGAEGVFGLGYNWNRVSLDFSGAVRSKDDYDVEDSDITFITGSLGLTFRF